jgi:hypothetical protein
MYQQQNILEAEDYRRKKINFWFIWTIGNALGTAIGWALGETFGRITSETLGIRTGFLIATLVFEISVWLPRIWISRYFQELNLFGFLEKIVWMTTEAFTWIIADAFMSTEVHWFTWIASYAIVMGGTMSMLLSIMGMTKISINKPARRKKPTSQWAIKTFSITLFWFISLSIIFSAIWGTSMEVEKIAQGLPPFVGWIISGLSFGGCVGAITGLVYIKSISQRESIQS